MTDNAIKEEPKSPKKRDISNFKIGPVIGEGAFSQVVAALEKDTKKLFAIKIMEKARIIKFKKQEAVFLERDTMNKLKGHPFFVKIYCSFQDKKNLYFVLSYARRGDLLLFILDLNGFDEETTRFYASQIVVALEYLHQNKIIHRDLKPENILVNEQYHIMITDFGTAKVLQQPPAGDYQTSDSDKLEPEEGDGYRHKSSFVGTAQYVSPELLIDKYVCTSTDLWSFGVTIYQMVTKNWPFSAPTDYLIFERIKHLLLNFPDSFFPLCKDLVINLLKIDPKSRLGDQNTGGYPVLKAHPFFKDTDWENIFHRNPTAQLLSSSCNLLPSVSEDDNLYFQLP